MPRRSRMGCVYKITNSVNDKIYIGLTSKTVEKRWKKHVSDAEQMKRPHAIHRAIRKYGAGTFHISILFESDSLEELNEMEKKSIELQNSMWPNGYNLHSGGEAHVISELTRNKMSLAQMGKKQSQQTKSKRSMKLSGKTQPKDLVKKRSKAISKPVVEITSGKSFDSINSASSYFNVKSRGISKNLHGKSDHYFGLKFKFLEKTCN